MEDDNIFFEHIGKITLPTDSDVITSPFGMRTLNGKKRFHKGIDLRAHFGDNIYAMADGIVTVLEYSNYNTIIINHNDNKTLTKYLHNSEVLVKNGQQVKSGDLIAKAGGCGIKNGKKCLTAYTSHLHFEVWVNNEYIDPELYLYQKNIITKRKQGLPKIKFPIRKSSVIKDMPKLYKDTCSIIKSHYTDEQIQNIFSKKDE